MDTLKNKQYRTDYEALSRYSSFPYYYNTKDKKFIVGLTSHLNNSTEYVAHILKQGDTLDSLALKYYGRPDYFWIIADFNRIKDPFKPLLEAFRTIKIPGMGQIEYEDK